MPTLIKISFCFLLVYFACKPDKQTTDGWTPVQKDIRSIPTTRTEEDFQILLQGYGFNEPDGRFLHYQKQSDSTAFLEWGDSSFQRIWPDTLWRNTENYWPVLDRVTNRYIVLKYGCGNPCWGKIVLPFDKKKEAKNYMYNYFFDAATHLVGYFDYNSDKNRFVVENVKTGKKQAIALQPACESAFGGYCIDSVQFVNRQLTISWKTPHAFADSVKTQRTFRKRISI